MARWLAPFTSGLFFVRRQDAGGVTEGDISTVRRLAPFASLPYWRWFIDNALVPGVKEAVAQ